MSTVRAVWNAVEDALRFAVYNAGGAVQGAVYITVEGAVRSAVDNAVSDAMREMAP